MFGRVVLTGFTPVTGHPAMDHKIDTNVTGPVLARWLGVSGKVSRLNGILVDGKWPNRRNVISAIAPFPARLLSSRHVGFGAATSGSQRARSRLKLNRPGGDQTGAGLWHGNGRSRGMTAQPRTYIVTTCPEVRT